MKLDFIQIGAHIGAEHDYVFSRLKDKKFLTGILVEPNPKAFKMLKEKYKENDLFFEEIAITTYSGKCSLYIESFEQDDYISQISSTIEDFTKNHPFGIGKNISKIEVNCKSLEDLWKEYNLEHVKCLVIDTEGNDFNILYYTDYSNMNIDEIIFENMHTDGIHNTGKKYNILIEHLKKNGYTKFITDGGNTHALK